MVKTRAMKAEEDRQRDAYLLNMASGEELQGLRNHFLPTARAAKVKVAKRSRPPSTSREKVSAYKARRIYDLFYNLGWTYGQIGK